MFNKTLSLYLHETKKITIVLGMAISASLSYAESCGTGYVKMFNVGGYSTNSDLLFVIDPTLNPIASHKFFDGALPRPLMRVNPNAPANKKEWLKSILQMAMAAKKPVWVDSITNDCSSVDSISIYDSSNAYNNP